MSFTQPAHRIDLRIPASGEPYLVCRCGLRIEYDWPKMLRGEIELAQCHQKARDHIAQTKDKGTYAH